MRQRSPAASLSAHRRGVAEQKVELSFPRPKVSA